MSFGSVLKKLRTDINLTQRQLAEVLCVSESTIGMYERGHREPDFETLEAIADYFNVDMDYLLGKSSVPNKNAEYFDSLIKSISDDANNGCFAAQDNMFQTFADARDSLSLRIVGSKFAVLFYHPFDSRDSAGRVMEILGMLRDLSQDELLAVAGMLRGFVNRKDLEA